MLSHVCAAATKLQSLWLVIFEYFSNDQLIRLRTATYKRDMTCTITSQSTSQMF